MSELLPASEWPPITELQKALWKDDPEFHAWACTVPDKHWAKYDLSALYVGFELGRRVALGKKQGEAP
jgi:hypothetical protein